LNQRPLGYEYRTAMIGNPLISWESVPEPAVPRYPMMRDSSSRFALFRDVMGAEWEQRLTVHMIDMVGDGSTRWRAGGTLRLTRLKGSTVSPSDAAADPDTEAELH